MVKLPELRRDFPFRSIFSEFLKEYSSSCTYWYIPKARSLGEEGTVADIKHALQVIFDKFLERIWNPDTQDKLLSCLISEGVLGPYKEGTKPDRTALIRIHKKLWEVLGLLWVEEDNSIVITDAGLEVLAERKPRTIIEGQIAKWQYPNPSMLHLTDFKGILPHLFLLQALKRLDYKISRDEFDLFVNLAQAQDDLERIVRYVKSWRDLRESEQGEILNLVKNIPFPSPLSSESLFKDEESEEPKRYNRINLNSAYQRAFYTYPHYLKLEEGNITCTSKEKVDELAEEKLEELKIPTFRNKADWFSYYGDPNQHPSWFTYLSRAVERAESHEEAKKLFQEGRPKLKPQEAEEIKRKEIEKGIEDFYSKCPSQIEEGLALLEGGRQYPTPIGPIDLLCRDRNGTYVVVEIKVDEASDAVFGQILRYIGWVHLNFPGGNYNVRGIILAAEFPEKARYSRVGLLKENHKEFLKFKRHGLNLQDT